VYKIIGGQKMKEMELKDTVGLMLSDDYRERLLGEYIQVNIRAVKLMDFIKIYEPNDDTQLLKDQLMAMCAYILALRKRADAENIDLKESTFTTLARTTSMLEMCGVIE
jgi:hypothetical protein